MFTRERYLRKIEHHFHVHSVCALLGARQVGKTTLARAFVKEQRGGEARFFDLERALDLARLENPMIALSAEPEKLVVIDEVQMRPDLFPVIRVLVDEPSHKRNLLILGSASRDLIRQSSETLAGRIGFVELPPFSFFLERDAPNLGFNIPPQQLRRFWLMLAHYHGQTFNASEIARSLGVSDHTVRRYLDILVGTFMVRELTPWFENLQKRQVRAPKIYFRDSGILHALLTVKTTTELDSYPKLGAFWEGFALKEIIKAYDLRAEGRMFFLGNTCRCWTGSIYIQRRQTAWF